MGNRFRQTIANLTTTTWTFVNQVVTGTLAVTGASTLASTLGVTGLSTLTGGAKVGASGSTITKILFGQASFLTGDTTKTLTLTGCTSSYKVVATINTGNVSAVTILTAAPGTDQVVLTLSGTPGATTLVTVIAFL